MEHDIWIKITYLKKVEMQDLWLVKNRQRERMRDFLQTQVPKFKRKQMREEGWSISKGLFKKCTVGL